MIRYCGVLVALFALVLPASADDRSDVLDAVAPLASALSSGDAAAFLGGFDKNMPGFDELSANVNALLAQAVITSSVEFISRGKDDTAQLEWYMEVKSKEEEGSLERRRETITIRLGKGKLLSITPVTFFRPMKVKTGSQ
jgi:hypothetical protein